MKKANQNQYRNRVRPVSIARWILAGFILSGFGIGYVYVKNNHVELGVQRGQLEEEIVMLSRQIEEADGWIGRMEDRKNLTARLERADSQLVRFGPSQVIKLSPIAPMQQPVRNPGENGDPDGEENPLDLTILGELAQNGG